MRGLLLALMVTCPALGAEPVKHPTAEFLALPLAQRNLAVYDAFWDALLANYYDQKLISAPEWRELRDEWREFAAAETVSSDLYGQLFDEIAAKLPGSHVGAELPGPERPVDGAAAKGSDQLQKLIALLEGGPGYYGTAVRRGRQMYGLVTEVVPGSPAEAAGISPGWRIVRAFSTLAVEDNAVRFVGDFIPLEGKQALAWERGEMQPVVADQWRAVRITFDHRPMAVHAPVESRRVGKDVSYLRFDAFGDDAYMNPVFDAVEGADAAGLIIDLRWNGGGFTHQLQRLAGRLLGGGRSLGTLQNSRGTEPMHAAIGGRRYEGPLMVLIGPSTGSCAEIFAAAVRDHERGKLVGRMTNGSTLITQAFPLPDGGFARVPITDFRTSRDARIEGVGVTPDLRVMPTLDDVRAARDPAVERALALLQAPSP